MAAGDVVNGISADNTILLLQPAIGIDLMITSVFADASNVMRLTDGAKIPFNLSAGVYQGNIKIGINNTNYLHLLATGAGTWTAYTGIQIK